MTVTERVRHIVESATGAGIVDSRPYAAGNNTVLFLLDLDDGSRLVAKIATKAGASLDIEGWMLEYLRQNSALPVPDVIASTPDTLVMTYVPSAGTMDEGAETHAAELLAALHGIRGECYGLERDTLIGPLRQPNKPDKNWISFFRDQRLMVMARAAHEENRIDNAMLKAIEKLAGKLEDYLGEPSPPSLLHGDVWGGNVLALPGKISGFIDPAIYYGDPEIELAFTMMFGTFGEAFFERYRQIRPIRDGFFEIRKDIYNLYPLLVHIRLYGRGYAGNVTRTLDRFAA